jgi:hypothetical protein
MGFQFSNLKEKAGPLPIWGWALITAFLGIGLFYYMHGRSKVANSGTSTTAQVPTDPYAAFANYSAAPTSVTPTDQGASGSYETNQSWLSKAVYWLTQQGKGTALDSQAALNNYLNNGTVLDQGQTQLVNAALDQFGLPPQPVFGAPSGTNPTPPSANPTVQGYIRSPNGSISAVFTNGTKGEFSSNSAYTTFSAAHPAGPWQQVSADYYTRIPTASTNPSF